MQKICRGLLLFQVHRVSSSGVCVSVISFIIWINSCHLVCHLFCLKTVQESFRSPKHSLLASGIVVSASRANTKASRVALQCRNCLTLRYVSVGEGFGGGRIPRKWYCTLECVCPRVYVHVCVRACVYMRVSVRVCVCIPLQLFDFDPVLHPNLSDHVPLNPDEERCPLDPFTILSDKSEFYDTQTLKLQVTCELCISTSVHMISSFIVLTGGSRSGAHRRNAAHHSAAPESLSGKPGQARLTHHRYRHPSGLRRSSPLFSSCFLL